MAAPVSALSGLVGGGRSVFREKVMTGRRGWPRLLTWAELQVIQVVKRFGKGRGDGWNVVWRVETCSKR